MQNPMNGAAVSLFLAIGLAAAPERALAQQESPPVPIDTVDLARYAGTWYEIARIPNRFQKDCVGAATATYELREDGRIDVINRCVKADGKVKEARGIARWDEDGEGARLEVSFFSILGWRPVWGAYWILDLGDEYEYSLVGEGSRKYGWILSRTPEMAEDRLAELYRTLEAQGYDPAKFEPVQGAGPTP